MKIPYFQYVEEMIRNHIPIIYSLKPSHSFNKSKPHYYTDDDYTESQREKMLTWN